MVTEKVAIVIPALNEEAALHRLLAELPPNFAQWVIVVDNGSTDATAAVAQRSGAIVASEPLRGYGRACLKGFKKACSLGAEVVIFMDGDGSDDPADLSMMLGPMREGRADVGKVAFRDREAHINGPRLCDGDERHGVGRGVVRFDHVAALEIDRAGAAGDRRHDRRKAELHARVIRSGLAGADRIRQSASK